MTLPKRLEGYLPVTQSPYMTSIDQRDLIPLEYRLAQGQSGAVRDGLAAPGEFFCPQTFDRRSSIHCVPLRIQGTRTLWSAELGPPRCASNDRVRPNPGSEFDGILCQDCQLRVDDVFSVDPEERRNRCLPGYTLLAWGIDIQHPFLYRVQGTSTRPMQSLITAILMQCGGVPFRAEVALESRTKTNRLGTFYVMVPRVLSVASLEEARECYEAMASAWAGQPINWAPGDEGTAQPGRAAEAAAPASSALDLDRDLDF